MNDMVNKTRIEVIRDNVVVNTVLPNETEGVDDEYKFSSSSSISGFPTLSIISSNSEINSSFMGFSKADVVRLSVLDVSSNEYTTLFEGEFSRKSTKFESKPEKLVLEVDAIHSFFMLSMFELSSSKDFLGVSFGEFVFDLVDMANIQSKVEIDEKLSSVKIVGLSHNTNAFRLFKEVCLIFDAVVAFNSDNTVNIDFRDKKLDEIRTREVQTIAGDEMINVVKKESIF